MAKKPKPLIQEGEKKGFLRKLREIIFKRRVVAKTITLDDSKIESLEPHILKERAQMHGALLAKDQQLKLMQEQINQLKNELNI